MILSVDIGLPLAPGVIDVHRLQFGEEIHRDAALLSGVGWAGVVLDEAQNIKNPGARQTRAVKTLRGRSRLALTGTPVENRLSDLWSLFDFLSPGLLGSARAFTAFTKELAKRPEEPYAPLRRLVQPYLLRRRKNDPRIIADLPDKLEMKVFCNLTKEQASLYGAVVEARDRQEDDAWIVTPTAG